MAQASAGPVRTFTVGFGEPRYDERAYARAVAERYGTEHEELVVEPRAVEVLPRLAWALDEPLGDEAALPLRLICEAARAHVTVALTGDGGDEAFAGYERYVAHGLAGRVGVVPALPRLGARAPGSSGSGAGEPRSTANRAARFLDAAGTGAAARYGRLMEVFPAELRAELWEPDFVADARPRCRAARPPPRAGITGLQLLDIETYLPGDLLPKADIASMAHSLELRSPFLDHHVLELGLALPDSLKRAAAPARRRSRRAFAADLPPEVAARRKKGFGVPLARWFRGELRELTADLLLDERARRAASSGRRP